MKPEVRRERKRLFCFLFEARSSSMYVYLHIDVYCLVSAEEFIEQYSLVKG